MIFPQHPKRDQTLKFTPLSETTSNPTFFIFESSPRGIPAIRPPRYYNQRPLLGFPSCYFLYNFTSLMRPVGWVQEEFNPVNAFFDKSLSIWLQTEVHCQSELNYTSHGITCNGLLSLHNSTPLLRPNFHGPMTVWLTGFPTGLIRSRGPSTWMKDLYHPLHPLLPTRLSRRYLSPHPKAQTSSTFTETLLPVERSALTTFLLLSIFNKCVACFDVVYIICT